MKLYNDENIKYIIKQYMDATGTKYCDVNSKEFLNELSRWLFDMKCMSSAYTDLLSDMGFKFDNCRCAEVGKMDVDSVVSNYSTTIITPDSYHEMESIDPNRVIISDFIVKNGEPVVLVKDYLNNIIEETAIPKFMIETYMTQNPYTEAHIANWDELYYRNNNKIIVGAFGSVSDKDKDLKIENLGKLQLRLEGNCVEEYTETNGIYLCVVASSKTLYKHLGR